MHVISVPYTENRIQKERMSLFVFFVIIAKHREGIQNYNSFLLKIYEMAYCLYVARGIVMPKSYNDILNGNALLSDLCSGVFFF